MKHKIFFSMLKSLLYVCTRYAACLCIIIRDPSIAQHIITCIKIGKFVFHRTAIIFNLTLNCSHENVAALKSASSPHFNL